MEYFIDDYLVYITSLVTLASFIAKVTPNETDNKVIAFIQRIVDAIAMSTPPTKRKK